MSNKKFHFVYKTVNNITGEYYIGVHSTNDLNDSYLGSGVRIRGSVRKHSKENFTRNILSIHETRAAALDNETRLVNKETLQDPLCLNLMEGGISSSVDPSLSTREKISKARKGWTPSDETRLRMSRAKQGKPSLRRGMTQIKIGKPQSVETRNKIAQALRGKVVSEETRLRLSVARRARQQPKHTAESRAKMSKVKQQYHKYCRDVLKETPSCRPLM